MEPILNRVRLEVVQDFGTFSTPGYLFDLYLDVVDNYGADMDPTLALIVRHLKTKL